MQMEKMKEIAEKKAKEERERLEEEVVSMLECYSFCSIYLLHSSGFFLLIVCPLDDCYVFTGCKGWWILLHLSHELPFFLSSIK